MSDLGQLTFLPFLRRGLAAAVTGQTSAGAPAEGGKRARPGFVVDLTVGGSATTITKTVDLLGPGDVVGLRRDLIIRTDPAPGTGDFEPGYLPSVELFDEDLPWRYTPEAPSGDRLRPWLALVVLRSGQESPEFVRTSPPGSPLPAVRVSDAKCLPPSTELWAWAHVQITGPLPAGPPADAVAALLSQAPERGISRILCPRRLVARTTYTAFLVPTYAAGREAGLGREPAVTGDPLAPAWTGTERDLVLPVYFEWSFVTGEEGDFEALVRRIERRKLDPEVGRRHIDVTAPGLGVKGVASPVAMHGAIRHVDATDEPLADADFRVDMGAILTRTTQTQVETLGPPAYGALQAGIPGWKQAGAWLRDLNLDVRARAAAGLGASIVRREQEALMEVAWKQLERVRAENVEIQRAQLAREVTARLQRKHLAPLPAARKLTVLGPMASKLRVAGGGTIAREVGASALGLPQVGASFRRVLRPQGPVVRSSTVLVPSVVTRMAAGAASGARERPSLTGAITMDRVSTALEKDARRSVAGELATRLPSGAMRLLGVLTSAVPRVQLPPSFEKARAARAMSGSAFGGTPLADPRPGFKLAGAPPAFATVPIDTADARWLRTVISPIEQVLASGPTATRPPALQLHEVVTAGERGIDRAIEARLKARLGGRQRVQRDPLAPVLAGPRIDAPVVKLLTAHARDAMVPNLDRVPRNTIALMKENRRFVEALLAGMNHEMARELLFRGYPTDRRGTYFRQMWEPSSTVASGSAEAYDILPIHLWPSSTSLGMHSSRPHPPDSVVFVLRSDLLTKYPTAVIEMAKAKWTDPGAKLPRDVTDEVITPTLWAHVEPDIVFVGFDLAVETVLGATSRGGDAGWFFVLRERPGEPRFGADEPPGGGTMTGWADLSWTELTDDLERESFVSIARGAKPEPTFAGAAEWGLSSAVMADVLFQDPVYVAVHARDLL